MAAKTKFGLKKEARASYLELVLAFPLATIKSDEHLEEAQQVMDRLLAKGDLDEGEELYLDADAIWSPVTRISITRSSRRRMPTCCAI